MADAEGNKTGGRQLGTPNKRTRDIIDMVEASGKNPIKVLLDLLDEPEPGLRLSAAKELAQYMFPKRRAVDVTSAGESVTPFSGVPVTEELLLKMVKTARNGK